MSNEANQIKPHKDVIVRYHDDGTVDEILVMRGKECLLHLEQIGDDCFWIGLKAAAGDYPIHVHLKSETPIVGTNDGI